MRRVDRGRQCAYRAALVAVRVPHDSSYVLGDVCFVLFKHTHTHTHTHFSEIDGAMIVATLDNVGIVAVLQIELVAADTVRHNAGLTYVRANVACIVVVTSTFGSVVSRCAFVWRLVTDDRSLRWPSQSESAYQRFERACCGGVRRRPRAHGTSRCSTLPIANRSSSPSHFATVPPLSITCW
jgi:hypothetical protein